MICIHNKKSCNSTFGNAHQTQLGWPVMMPVFKLNKFSPPGMNKKEFRQLFHNINSQFLLSFIAQYTSALQQACLDNSHMHQSKIANTAIPVKHKKIIISPSCRRLLCRWMSAVRLQFPFHPFFPWRLQKPDGFF